jgi:hypothetical protein
MPPEPAKPRSTVFLRHELPDGFAHVDWLIAPPGEGSEPDDRVLMSWRISEETAALLRSGGGQPIEFEAIRLPDHRFRYLDYEGPVSGDRGEVARLCVGGIAVFEEGVDRFSGLLAMGGVWRLSGLLVGPAPAIEDAGLPPLGKWKFSACEAAG